MLQPTKCTFSRSSFAIISVVAIALFTGRGVVSARAQTSTTPSQANSQSQSDFQKDVEDGKQQIVNDKVAQNNQREIDDEENEKAGDQYGDHQVIDGEKPELEIEQEIENEVEIETEGGQNDQESGNRSTSSTENHESDASSTGSGEGD